MTHTLTTDSAKNYCNRTLIVKVIVKNVVKHGFFFGGGGTVLCCEMFRLTSKRTQLYQHNELTANVDFQFTQVCLRIFNRKLYDEVSIGRQAAVALQKDCGTVSNSARVLTTDGVVPQCRCRDER